MNLSAGYAYNASYSDRYPNGYSGLNLFHLVVCLIFTDAAASGKNLAIFQVVRFRTDPGAIRGSRWFAAIILFP